MLVLLPILHDYINDCEHIRSLGIAAQIKKGRTTIGICRFIVCYLCHYFLPAFRKVQDCVMEEEEFEDLEYYLVFFLDFIL
jgi:hypothetical protein